MLGLLPLGRDLLLGACRLPREVLNLLAPQLIVESLEIVLFLLASLLFLQLLLQKLLATLALLLLENLFPLVLLLELLEALLLLEECCILFHRRTLAWSLEDGVQVLVDYKSWVRALGALHWLRDDSASDLGLLLTWLLDSLLDLEAVLLKCLRFDHVKAKQFTALKPSLLSELSGPITLGLVLFLARSLLGLLLLLAEVDVLSAALLLPLDSLLVLSLDLLFNEAKLLFPLRFLFLFARFLSLLLHQSLLSLLVEVLCETRELAFESVLCERYLNLRLNRLLNHRDCLSCWRLLGWLWQTFGLSGGFRPKGLFQHSMLLFGLRLSGRCLNRRFWHLRFHFEALRSGLDL